MEAEEESIRKKPWRCDICDMCFLKRDHLQRHQSIHSEERPYKCKRCEKTFKRDTHLRRHIQNAHHFKNLMCEECGKTFSGPEQLRRHELRHEEKKNPLTCNKCGKKFGRRAKLELHKFKIHGPFNCADCPKVFYSRRELKFHIKTTHIEEKFPCPYCVMSFPNSRARSKHVAYVHESFRCPHCPAKFTRARRLNKHIESKHHVDALTDMTCCEDELDVHVVDDSMVSGESGDSCEIAVTSMEVGLSICAHCGLTFTTQSNLNQHMKVSHSDKPPEFRCNICSKVFRYKHVLNRHLRNVHDEAVSTTDSSASTRHKEELALDEDLHHSFEVSY